MPSHQVWCVVSMAGGRTAKSSIFPATMPTAWAQLIQVCLSARMLAIRSAARCRIAPIFAACARRSDQRKSFEFLVSSAHPELGEAAEEFSHTRLDSAYDFLFDLP